MTADVMFRLFGGLAIAITLYILLPVLDLLEIAFYLALGVIWGAVVVDLVFLSIGLIGSMGEGVVAWSQGAIRGAQSKVQNIKADLASRVEAAQEAPAT